MKKTIALVCLLTVVPAVQATHYKNVETLMKTFLDLRKEKDKPLTDWISQLIETIQHEKKFKPFISMLKRAKQDPDKLLKAFTKHKGLFNNAVKVYLLKKGNKAIKKAFDARAQIGSPLAVTTKQVQALTPGEKVAVFTTHAQQSAPPVVKLIKKLSPAQELMMARYINLLNRIEDGSLTYTPLKLNFAQWKRLCDAALRNA